MDRLISPRKDVDLERHGPKKDGTRLAGVVDHQALMKKIISHWDVMVLVVCVAAVATDPFFFYLPVINEATKCIKIDKTLKIIAICLRSFLDLVALGDLVAIRKLNKCSHMQINNKCLQEENKCPHRMKRSDYVINILSILPVHQVLMPIIFSEMRDSKIPHAAKFLNAVVVLQFVPRISRIYRLWKIVNKTIVLPKHGSFKENKSERSKNDHVRGFLVMKGGFNFFLYLVASHALGAFWYFFSIERETRCWQLACEHDTGCIKDISLQCGTHDGIRNYTFINDFCSIEKPNTAQRFDFGIFEDAIQSGVLTSMDFPRKMLFCFWWGLRNLSSFGQNLQTTPYYWENCFTVLISMIGLLLFLYFIGNLQVYMQQEASKELEEITSKCSTIIQTRLDSIESWISTIGLTSELKEKIKSYMTPIVLEDLNNHIDTENPFPHLPKALRRLIKLHVCLPLLRKVPIFKNESEKLLNEIACKFLKQVHYNQNSYIVREGEPLDVLLFMVKGIAWSYTRNPGNKTECLKADNLLGKDLVEWVLESPELSDLPLSTRTLKCHTKVEGFCLMASDLKDMMSQCWWKFSKFKHITQSDSKQLKYFAASSIQAAWRRHAIHPR